MTTTNKRLAGPAAGPTSATTVYTCNAANGAVIRHIRLSNPTGSPITFSLSIGAMSTAANRLYDGYSVPANNANTPLPPDLYGPISLANGDTLQVLCGSASLIYEIDGQEFS